MDYSVPEPSTPPEAWRRRADESARAFRAFTVYLALDADRSLAKVGRKLGVSKALAERWSVQHDWVARTRQYDGHLSELRLERLATARDNLVDVQVRLAQKMFSLVESSMARLRKRKRLNPQETSRMFYVAAKAVQAVFGDSEPLANERPKIVVLQIERNKPRDFEAEARAAAERAQ